MSPTETIVKALKIKLKKGKDKKQRRKGNKRKISFNSLSISLPFNFPVVTALELIMFNGYQLISPACLKIASLNAAMSSTRWNL